MTSRGPDSAAGSLHPGVVLQWPPGPRGLLPRPVRTRALGAGRHLAPGVAASPIICARARVRVCVCARAHARVARVCACVRVRVRAGGVRRPRAATPTESGFGSAAARPRRTMTDRLDREAGRRLYRDRPAPYIAAMETSLAREGGRDEPGCCRRQARPVPGDAAEGAERGERERPGAPGSVAWAIWTRVSGVTGQSPGAWRFSRRESAATGRGRQAQGATWMRAATLGRSAATVATSTPAALRRQQAGPAALRRIQT